MKVAVVAMGFMGSLLAAGPLQSAVAAEADACRAVASVAAEPVDEELLLQVVLDGEDSGEMVRALRRGGQVLLPLARLSALLDFPIRMDANAPVARGWFIRERDTLCVAPGSAWIKGRREAVEAGEVLALDGDLFVDARRLAAWMPLSLATDLRRMTLAVTSREALPARARRAREQARRRLVRTEAATVPSTRVDFPYALAQWPTLDLSVGHARQSHGAARSDVSALAVGDVGFLTSRLFASASDGPYGRTDLRLSFGRDDRDGQLLGAAHATSFRFGDIDSIDLPQAVGTAQARGLRVTNRSLDRADSFEVTSFTGDSQPGWQVELYRNDALIGFQAVAGDGRYAFNAVPVLFGSNRFRLVFYGPQGQVEELTRTVDAESSLLEPGQFTYNLAVGEKNRSWLAGRERDVRSDRGPVDVVQAEYGLAKGLTLTAGAARNTLLDGLHDYATVGLRTSVAGVLAAFDHADEMRSGGRSDRILLSANLRDTLVSFKARFANRFENEESASLADPLRRQLAFSVDRWMSSAWLGDFRSAVSMDQRLYASGRRELLWSHQFSRNLTNAVSLTHTLAADRDNRGLDQLGGTAFLRAYVGGVALGGQFDYVFRPAARVREVRLSGLFNLGPSLRNQVTVSRLRMESRVNQVEESVILDRGTYQLSFIGRASDRGDLFAGIVCSTSISRVPNGRGWMASSKPLAETGIVAVRPYIDGNYDQQRQPGEAAPAGIAVRVGGRSLGTDGSGTAIATQLPVNLPVEVEIEPASQEGNPMWSAARATYTVVPRPGRVMSLDLPVFETSQVSGTVRVPAGAKPAGVLVELVDAEGQVLRSTRSAFDGYYLIESVLPGRYRLRVTAAGLRQGAEATLAVTRSDFFVKDLELGR